MKYVAIFLMVVMALIMISTLSMAAGPWKGKIIDIETKEPLEGAVVVAVWERVYRTPAGPNSYFYEAKEVLTDKEGRFEMPSYTPVNLLPIISFIRGPNITIFKYGYGNFPNYHELIVVPIKNVNVVKSIKWKDRNNVESIEQGIVKEGIIFSKRSAFEKVDPNIFREKFGLYVPFIPLENAENRVRNLDIPFEYKFSEDMDKIWRVWYDVLSQKAFVNYTLVGLKKLKTWLERIESYESADINGDIPDSKIPKFRGLMKEEDSYLKPMYRFDRKKLNIPIGELPK